MDEPEIRDRWWCAGRALAEGTAALGEGGGDRAEDGLRKEGRGEEVKATRMKLVVHRRDGVWRRASQRSRLGEERGCQEGG